MELLSKIHLGLRTKLPIVFQSEAAECGLACLAMICGYYRGPTELSDLRRRFGVSLKGARMSDLISVADHLGFASRALRLELDEMDQLQLPCILHWDLNHFVVLRSVSRQGVVVHDPALGLRRLSMKQVSEHFSGVALELRPTRQFEPAKSRPALRLRDVIGRVVGFRRSLAQVFALALAIELFLLVQPFFMQWVIDHALVSADRELLLTLALGFSLVMLLQVAFTAMRGWMLMAIGASLQVQSRGSLFSHLQKLPASFFESRQLGDVLSRFESMDAIQHALTTDLVEALLDGLFALVTVAIMFVLSPPLAAVVVGGAVVYGVIRWLLYAPLHDASLEAIIWAARRDTHFLETVRAVRTIKLLVGQDTRRAHWLNLLVETVNRQLSTQKLALLFRTVSSLLQGGLMILIVWLGAQRVLDNVFSIGTLLAFVAYKDQFLTRISALIDRGVELRMLRLHAERLSDIVLTAPEQTAARKRPVGEQAAVSLRGVRYRYGEHDPWVLDGIDLDIAAGESVAIVGPSGCGKSTLLKIVSSLVAPTSGEVLINGEPLAHLGLDGYRNMIGVVMQDDQLLAGSIADNIAFFSSAPDRARIEACARVAAIHEDVVAMPMGYESLIGDMGSSISGGQKQRLLLARALYREPQILLLDEATSHLDVELERAVNRAIADKRMTRIIVAHRPDTIRSADRVVTLHRGKVVDDQRLAPVAPAHAVPAVPAARADALPEH
jgi:ATP-binding cassette subfamily B protein RaxB